ncbi:MAG: hypothetical protein QS748_08855 [Candidatus Endonucleobacter bathymodioli]|uniref:Uncharacterized protein n=1 Tax=Candidatus Endonucleibacter bathymodioli TaxID=539814 RepID=A0AA90NW68_9GAMM|nr:hypothetical protein [Candidatus Endonucleobacter bathymodioli]
MNISSVKKGLLAHTHKYKLLYITHSLFVTRSLFICLLLSQHAVSKYEIVCESSSHIEIQTYTYKNDDNDVPSPINEPSSKIASGINAWLVNNTISSNLLQDKTLFRIIVPTKNLDATLLDENASPFWITTETSDADISDYAHWPLLHQVFFPEQGIHLNKVDFYKTLTYRFYKLWSMVTEPVSKSCRRKIPDIYQMNQKNGYLPLSPFLTYLRQQTRIKHLQYIVPEEMDKDLSVIKFQLWLTKTDACPSGSKFCASHFQWTLFPYMDPTKEMYATMLDHKTFKIKCRRLSSDIHFLCIVPTISDAKEIKDIVMAEEKTSVQVSYMSAKIKTDVSYASDTKEKEIKEKFLSEADKVTGNCNLKRLTLSLLVVESHDATDHFTGEQSAKKKHSRRKDRFSSTISEVK